VSGRPTRNRKGAILSRISRRNGERHPDPRDAGSLRGMSEKRGSRPVRTRSQQVSSSVNGRTGDSGCPLEAAGGERRQHAPGARTRHGDQRVPVPEDTSFARSRDPCTSRHSRGTAFSVSRSGKLTKVRGNRHRGRNGRTHARLAARHRSSKSRATVNKGRSCVMRKKRKKVEAFVPARKRELGLSARTS